MELSKMGSDGSSETADAGLSSALARFALGASVSSAEAAAFLRVGGIGAEKMASEGHTD